MRVDPFCEDIAAIGHGRVPTQPVVYKLRSVFGKCIVAREKFDFLSETPYYLGEY